MTFRALGEAARNVMTGRGAFRLAAVSAADPVDRWSGRLVQLPDAPLPVGLDLGDPLGDPLLDHAEDLGDGAARGLDAVAESGLDLSDGRGQILWGGLPMRQGLGLLLAGGV